MINLSIYIAFIAGVLTFFSPCVLPILPSYILYITGVTFKDYSESTKQIEIRKLTIINSLLFILGFSFVFISLGAMASLLGKLLFQYRDAVRIIGGAIIIILGLYIMGIFKLPFLSLERRFHLKSKPTGYLGSVVLGATFAAAWTSCAGPILGSILILASAAETLGYGILLLIFYSLGLAIPFFITSLGVNSALVYFKRIEKYMGSVSIASGVFLILVGLLLLTNYFQFVMDYLINLFEFKGI